MPFSKRLIVFPKSRFPSSKAKSYQQEHLQMTVDIIFEAVTPSMIHNNLKKITDLLMIKTALMEQVLITLTWVHSKCPFKWTPKQYPNQKAPCFFKILRLWISDFAVKVLSMLNSFGIHLKDNPVHVIGWEQVTFLACDSRYSERRM